jgi:hypothetical protein
MTKLRPSEPPASPHGVPLVPRRPLWLRLLDSVFLAKFCLTIGLIWVTVQPTSCEGKKTGEPYQLTGTAVLQKKPEVLAVLLVVATVVVLSLFLWSHRRTALHTTGVGLLRFHLVLAALAGLYYGVWFLFDRTTWEEGFYYALLPFALMALVQLAYTARAAWPLPRHLWRHPPWRRRNWWLLPPVALSLLAVLTLVGYVVYSYLTDVVRASQAPGYSWSMSLNLEYGFIGLIGSAFLILVLLSALGIWYCETWGAWVHLLILGAPATLWSVEVGFDSSFWDNAWWRIPLMALLAAWILYGFIVGYRFSGHWFQRRTCWECGRKRWIRADRCAVCGERYFILRGLCTAPVCLACGHERPGPIPTCRQCGKKGSVPAALAVPAMSGESEHD